MEKKKAKSLKLHMVKEKEKAKLEKSTASKTPEAK